MRPLILIFISEGCSDGYFWLALDGDGPSLEPTAIVGAFPELLASAAIVRGYEERSDIPLSAVRAASSNSAVCVIEAKFETRIFTTDELLHQTLLERLKTCLPDKP